MAEAVFKIGLPRITSPYSTISSAGLFGTADIPGADGTVNAISFRNGNTVAVGEVNVALYEDLALIGQGTITTTAVNAWHDVSLGEDISINSTSTYCIVFLTSNTINNTTATATITERGVNTGVTSFPTTLSWTESTDRPMLAYAGVLPLPNAGAWSAGGNLNNSVRGSSGAGTQSAGLNAGGRIAAPTANCEEYNGSSWSASGSLSEGRMYATSCGTQTAALLYGGLVGASYDTTDTTLEYNGSSWSIGGTLSADRRLSAGFGTQTAGVSAGGFATLTITQEYNGTAWSSGGGLSTGRNSLAGAGTLSAGLAFGGTTNTDYLSVTEEYNGTVWSSGGALNTGRRQLGGCGTQTAGLSFGGSTGTDSTVTEEYDGTSWGTSGSLNTGRQQIAGCGTQASALSMGGTSSGSNITEEYTKVTPPTLAATVTTNITSDEADAASSVTSDGGATITERGFVYSEQINPVV